MTKTALAWKLIISCIGTIVTLYFSVSEIQIHDDRFLIAADAGLLLCGVSIGVNLLLFAMVQFEESN